MTVEFTASVIILILSATIIVQAVMFQKERAELLDRIMARDLGELRAFNDQTPIGKRSNHVEEAIKRAQAERG